MYKFLDDDHMPAKHLESSMLLATFYYKHVEPLYYLQQDASRNLMQDGDPETFAMLLSMKLPDVAIKKLPPNATTSDNQRISDLEGTTFDLVVGDLTRQDGNLSLLDYALNLSPALRDAITRDVAQNVSKYEPRLPRPFLGFKPDSSLREGSVQPKAAYLLQPPKARE